MSDESRSAPPLFVPRTAMTAERSVVQLARRFAKQERGVVTRAISFADQMLSSWLAPAQERKTSAPAARYAMPWYDDVAQKGEAQAGVVRRAPPTTTSLSASPSSTMSASLSSGTQPQIAYSSAAQEEQSQRMTAAERVPAMSLLTVAPSPSASSSSSVPSSAGERVRDLEFYKAPAQAPIGSTATTFAPSVQPMVVAQPERPSMGGRVLAHLDWVDEQLAARQARRESPTPELALPVIQPVFDAGVDPVRAEAQRVEAQRAQARIEMQRAQARTEAQRIEAQRVEHDHIEGQRQAQRTEAQRVEAQRTEAQRTEAQRVEAQRVEAQRTEAQRVEAQRVEAQRTEAQRTEAQRTEAQRIEAQRTEAQRVDAQFESQRVEAQLAEERSSAQSSEAKRIESQRLDADRAQTQRPLSATEAQRAEAERTERIQAQVTAQTAAQRSETHRLETQSIEAQRVEAQRAEFQRTQAQSTQFGQAPRGSLMQPSRAGVDPRWDQSEYTFAGSGFVAGTEMFVGSRGGFAQLAASPYSSFAPSYLTAHTDAFVRSQLSPWMAVAPQRGGEGGAAEQGGQAAGARYSPELTYLRPQFFDESTSRTAVAPGATRLQPSFAAQSAAFAPTGAAFAPTSNFVAPSATDRSSPEMTYVTAPAREAISPTMATLSPLRLGGVAVSAEAFASSKRSEDQMRSLAALRTLATADSQVERASTFIGDSFTQRAAMGLSSVPLPEIEFARQGMSPERGAEVSGDGRSLRADVVSDSLRSLVAPWAVEGPSAAQSARMTAGRATGPARPMMMSGVQSFAAPTQSRNESVAAAQSSASVDGETAAEGSASSSRASWNAGWPGTIGVGSERFASFLGVRSAGLSLDMMDPQLWSKLSQLGTEALSPPELALLALFPSAATEVAAARSLARGNSFLQPYAADMTVVRPAEGVSSTQVAADGRSPASPSVAGTSTRSAGGENQSKPGWISQYAHQYWLQAADGGSLNFNAPDMQMLRPIGALGDAGTGASATTSSGNTDEPWLGPSLSASELAFVSPRAFIMQPDAVAQPASSTSASSSSSMSGASARGRTEMPFIRVPGANANPMTPATAASVRPRGSYLWPSNNEFVPTYLRGPDAVQASTSAAAAAVRSRAGAAGEQLTLLAPPNEVAYDANYNEASEAKRRDPAWMPLVRPSQPAADSSSSASTQAPVERIIETVRTVVQRAPSDDRVSLADLTLISMASETQQVAASIPHAESEVGDTKEVAQRKMLGTYNIKAEVDLLSRLVLENLKVAMRTKGKNRKGHG